MYFTYICVPSAVGAKMADRTCTRCSKAFAKPTMLQRHLRRKTPCEIILDRGDLPAEVRADPALDAKRCHFCGRVFSSRDAKNRHMRTTCKIAPNSRNGEAGLDLLYEHVMRQQAQIDAQQAQIDELCAGAQVAGRGGVAAGRDVNANVNTNIHGNVTVDNRQDNRRVTIAIFGHENTDHITGEGVRTMFDECIGDNPSPELAAHDAVGRLVRWIYGDPAHPENYTCFMPSQKRKTVVVHARQGWTHRPAQMVLPPMAQKALDEFMQKQPYADFRPYVPMVEYAAAHPGELTDGRLAQGVALQLRDLLQELLGRLPAQGETANLAPAGA